MVPRDLVFYFLKMRQKGVRKALLISELKERSHGVHRRYLWIHNHGIEGFRQIKRRLRQSLHV
jgi:hypothetical protein